MNDFFLLLILLFLSGLFSGSETALVALSLARAEGLVREGRRGAQALFELKRDPSRMLITILIGNNLVNIGASAMATVLATRWFGSIGPGIAVGVLTVLILVFGEITPKSLATRFSERISLFIAPIMLGFMRLIFPAVWLFNQLTNWVQRKAGEVGDPTVTESELMSMVEYGEEEGTIESDEREMIQRVFTFSDLEVKDVMTPRRSVFSLDGRRKIAEVLPEVMNSSFSRIPLHEGTGDEITRVLYLRDLFEALVTERQDRPVSTVGRIPLFVPTNQPIDELTTLLRRKKQHLAIAVDEHGSMQGVVTLEDLLEELVGEIYDESDVMPLAVLEVEPGRIVVDGGAELRLVEEYFQRDLPGKPTDTVSRWILDHMERIPVAEESFYLDGMEVTVQGASGSRIHQVMLYRPLEDKELAEEGKEGAPD